MAFRDIDGYLKQEEDDSIHTPLWHRMHTRAVCGAVFLAGVVSLSLWAAGELQVQVAGSEQSEVENLASWPSGMHAGAGTGKGFAPVGQNRPRFLFRSRPRMDAKPLRGRDMRARSEGQKMMVPLDSFGGLSPERKAAQQLERFFTLCAVKSVLEQMEAQMEAQKSPKAKEAQKSKKAASDVEASKSEAALDAAEKLEKDYTDLLNFYETEAVTDPDEWVQKLMSRNNMLALRIMQARKSYADNSFEWDWVRQMSMDALADGNEKIMKAWAEKAFNMTSSAAQSAHEAESRA